MELSKPEYLVGGWLTRHGITESGFAAHARCWADLMRRHSRQFILAFAMLLAALPAAGEAESPAPELVMSPGCEITARTPKGVIRIRAGDVIPPGKDKVVKTPVGTVTIRATEFYPRTYYWGRCEGTAKLEPRNQRWHGSLGAYFPGTGFHWHECEGVARAVVEEGQQHFATVEDAMAWLNEESKWMPYVYRNDGLAVAWRTVIPERKQLNVDVWQILIGGRRPTRLPDADDNAISSSCP
jgi:hypothetical protein